MRNDKDEFLWREWFSKMNKEIADHETIRLGVISALIEQSPCNATNRPNLKDLLDTHNAIVSRIHELQNLLEQMDVSWKANERFIVAKLKHLGTTA